MKLITLGYNIKVKFAKHMSKPNKQQTESTDVVMRVKSTAEDVFKNETQLDVDSQRKNVVGWDSLGNLRLMMSLEKEFDIFFNEDDFAEIQSIGDICRIIENKIE